MYQDDISISVFRQARGFPRFLLAVPAVVMTLGCASAPLPTEPLTAANAGRLEMVYKARLGDYGYLPLPEYDDTIGDVAIDSSRHVMYFTPGWRPGLLPSLIPYVPVGVSAIDLRSGFEVRRTRIPHQPDMTGDTTVGGGPLVMADDRRHVFVSAGWHRGWPLDLASEVAFSDKYGEARWGLVRLDLQKDEPQLVAQSVGFAPHPQVDAHRLMILWSVWGWGYHPQIGYVDRASGRIAARVAAINFERRGSEDNYRGGVGDYVLVRASSPKSELLVLAPEGGELKPVGRLVLDDWRAGVDAVDWIHRRWIVSESQEGGGRRVRVYDVPTLKVLGELPEGAFGRHPEGMVCVPKTSLLAVVPENSEQELVVFDLDSSKEIARRRLFYWGFPPWQSWRPVADPEGIYIGALGETWVNLFAVRPG